MHSIAKIIFYLIKRLKINSLIAGDSFHAMGVLVNINFEGIGEMLFLLVFMVRGYI